jgi:hypothetical protein
VSGPAIAQALVALDARAWAQLLRAVRLVPDAPGPVAAALGRSTSELSGGPARRELCDALAAAPEVLELLRRDDALPAAVHAAIAAGDEAPEPEPSPEVSDVPGDPEEREAREARADVRSRELRRALDDERRRREGAEARATAAEAREQATGAERDRLAERVAALESDLAGMREAVDQAAARAERRAMTRAESLERELAAERSALASHRRDHDRATAELAELQREVDELRARSTSREPAAASEDGARPLVLPEGLVEGTTEAARWFASRASVLLVDGYNAAFQLRQNQPMEEQRRWLVERMRPLAARGGAVPVVVFDGAGVTGRMRDTGGIEVRFTSGGVIADDEIVFAVAATDRPVLVVTDDVELQERVRAEGGNVVGVVHLAGIIDG